MPDDVIGVVLAGGQSRRMGGADKGLAELAGRPLVGHVIDRVRPQVGTLILNSNAPPERYGAFGLPLVADDLPAGVEAFAGPLAGVLGGLDWAAAHAPAARWIATVAADAPFVPEDLVGRLCLAVDCESADLACAASGGRSHPVFGLWPVRLRRALRRAVAEEGVRKVDAWTARYQLVEVSYGTRPVDPFFNVNRPEDLAEAERLIAA